MAVALIPAITVIPTASESSSADLRVTSAVRSEPNINCCPDKGSERYHLLDFSLHLVPYAGFWQIPIF